jgi:hypothetical protein
MNNTQVTYKFLAHQTNSEDLVELQELPAGDDIMITDTWIRRDDTFDNVLIITYVLDYTTDGGNVVQLRSGAGI